MRRYRYFLLLLLATMVAPMRTAFSAEKITVALPSKAFQFIIFPIARDRGYFSEEGIDVEIAFMQSAAGIQAMLADSAQFTGSGSSALIAVTKGNAPLKTVMAVNDKVLQWLMAPPQVSNIKELANKKIAVSGVASIATFMFKRVAPKFGLDAAKSVTFIAPGANNRVPALVSGAVDAALIGTEERYAAMDHGMKQLMFLGDHVKNSWGTIATTDQFVKDKPKVMAGFMRALVKALRVVHSDRKTAIATVVKFSGLKEELAGRMYDDLIGTFTKNGAVDAETQNNDLDIVRELVKVKKDVPIERAYDFSFVQNADKELTKANWKP